MNTDITGKDKIRAAAVAAAMLVGQVSAAEAAHAPVATYRVECLTARPGFEQQVADTQAQIAHLRALSGIGRLMQRFKARWVAAAEQADALSALMQRTLMVPKWSLVEHNLVLTAGKNDLLDKYLSGSAYTAAWFCGLISSVSYSAIVAGDTAASHAGWTEAGGTNAPTYSGNRPALAFSAASAGSKATSSASSFTFTGPGTIKGMFANTGATKDSTTGVTYNAVLFTGGDRAVVSTDVVNVSVTYGA